MRTINTNMFLGMVTILLKFILQSNIGDIPPSYTPLVKYKIEGWVATFVKDYKQPSEAEHSQRGEDQ